MTNGRSVPQRKPKSVKESTAKASILVPTRFLRKVERMAQQEGRSFSKQAVMLMERGYEAAQGQAA
ncbi:hypothetical protein [Pseudoxanthomonas sp. SE1]|uniref:hypothetical protein n=1 Tax=Pseudoxanthomonas sp. SE1 TaxID=1664560 RepID=UPI00240D9DBA|nr:hypothetical protein [Pseudoxanthomonas sp. SE1]WFC43211.1 hypothetical protein OY559_06790 [Pseudoxanthomonas sp. SE1]